MIDVLDRNKLIEVLENIHSPEINEVVAALREGRLFPKRPKTPHLAVDVLIEMPCGGIVLIKRRGTPSGWAIPGGYVDYGESVEAAAIREAKEETHLDVKLLRQLKTYSDPKRDPRVHTVSVVFEAQAEGVPVADDDAKDVGIFSKENIPTPLCFDHAKIISDYFNYREGLDVYKE